MSHQSPILQMVRLAHAKDLPLPRYETLLSAGCDLRAALVRPYVLAPMARCLVPTGFKVAIPEGFEGQIRARSGLALRHGIGLPNGVGTIDADYRGELKVLLCNWGNTPFTMAHGDRIAQLVVAPMVQASFSEVEELDATERGEGGFGSTGI